MLGNDTDADRPLTAVYTDPQHGTLSHNPDGNFTYTPGSNFNGQDSFTYRANDGQSDSAPATVTISVNPVDDAPVAVGDAARVRENSGATTIAVLANDPDIDGGPKSVAAITQPAHGSAAIVGAGAGVTYKPRRGYCNTGKGGVRTRSATAQRRFAGDRRGHGHLPSAPDDRPPRRTHHPYRHLDPPDLQGRSLQGTLSLQATSLGTRLHTPRPPGRPTSTYAPAPPS